MCELRLNLKSLDVVHSSIKEGKTYDFTTRGFRISIMPKFPNIDTATEVKS